MRGLAALAIAYVLSQFYRSFLAVLTPQLTLDLHMSKSELSLASGIWFISFALMQFVVGVGLDRYGPKRTAALIFGAGACSGALLFASAQSPVAVIIAMCLFGIGCSPVLMAALFIFAQRFKASTFAVMTSSLVAFGNTGNVIGATPLATAVTLYGWREVMVALGIVSALVSLAIYWFVRDPEVQSPQRAGLSGYKALLQIRILWPVMAMILLCYAPVANIRGLWAGPYLTDTYQASSLQIGHVTLMMAIAMIMGSLLYGPLDKIVNSRKWVIFSGNMVVLAALVLLAINPSNSIERTTMAFVVIGLCGTSYGVLMAHGRAFLPAHLVGRGVTLLNFCSIFGAGVMQFLSGQVISARADPSAADSYQVLFGVYAATLSVALCIYLFSRDAPPHQVEQPAA